MSLLAGLKVNSRHTGVTKEILKEKKIWRLKHDVTMLIQEKKKK